MQTPGKLSITPVTAAVTAALYPGYAAVAQEEPGSKEYLDEIIVTSRKRTESIQDIPATIQSITSESLAAMGAKTMEDYSRFVPSVNVVTYSGNSSTVVFRGAITGPDYIGQATSSVYLDEISVTQTGSQPSIRAVDLARVEALSGPQGTLYGSDAQAGTMRIITNKPVMNSYQAIFDGEVRAGDESDMSYRGSLVFNVPLIEDRLALRVVGFNDRDGGFIDNVFGHTADWHGLDGTNKAPAGWGTLDNAHAVEENWNENDVYGGRVHLRWEMNDDWSTTFSFHNQRAEQGGDNSFDPFVGDLQTIKFHDDYNYETFNMGSLVVEGNMEFAQLVAAISYFDRDRTGMNDCTTYCHYWASGYCHDSNYTAAYIDANPQYFPYYTADNVFTNPDTGYVVWWPVYCQGPTVDSDFYSSYPYESNDDKLTAELRLSSAGDTFDWIVGAYFEESKDSWLAPFATPTDGGRAGTGENNLWQQSIAAQYHEWFFTNYYGTPTTFPNATSHWSSGSHTDWEQFAVFGEATWHINDQWNLTLGGRYFDRSNENFYFVNHPGGTDFNEGEPDTATEDIRQFRLANDLRPFGRKGEEQKFVPKVSLSYAIGDDKMAYGLYTEGVRQGGINRTRGKPFFPTSYESDLMKNYELGYKSHFANGRGRFNITGYYMQWEDYQLSIVDPSQEPCPDPNDSIPGQCGQPWQQVIANLGEAHIQGIVVDLDYVLSDNWLLGFNFEEIEAETDTAHDLNGDDIINTSDGDLTKGLRLPLVPDFKTSAWIEYRAPTSWLGGQEFFVRTQWSHTGDSFNLLEPLPKTDPNARFKSDAFTIGDIRAGIVGLDWQVDVFVNNVTDERALYTINTGQYEWGAAQIAEGRPHHQSVFTNRPLEFGVRYMKRWGD